MMSKEGEPPVKVKIKKDRDSVLWYISCVENCGWHACEVCWLGSAMSRSGAVALAFLTGYEVVDEV